MKTMSVLMLAGMLALAGAAPLHAEVPRRVENACELEAGMYRVTERIWHLVDGAWVLVSERSWLAHECPPAIIE